MISVGIFGATGYAGQQLVWFLNSHEEVNLNFLSSNTYAGNEFNEVYHNYLSILNMECINISQGICKIEEVDIIFLALPHGKSFDIIKKAMECGTKVIDLGADYRLKNVEDYEKWYGVEHKAGEIIEKFVYGLCELKRENIKKADYIANPGCYTTASILAMYPLVKENMIDHKSIIIDAKSGVSGAGRSLKTASLFSECNESLKAYGVGNHRHTPEIEQELSLACEEKIVLNFTPHLIPMNRGILATCYANLNKNYSEKEIASVYEKYYGKEYFIRLVNDLPQTKNVKGSNFCDIGFKVDKRTNRIIIISAIDNLIKGAAGQAVQNMNIIMGIEETKGINTIPIII